jgi:hypothetical protein
MLPLLRYMKLSVSGIETDLAPRLRVRALFASPQPLEGAKKCLLDGLWNGKTTHHLRRDSLGVFFSLQLIGRRRNGRGWIGGMAEHLAATTFGRKCNPGCHHGAGSRLAIARRDSFNSLCHVPSRQA